MSVVSKKNNKKREQGIELNRFERNKSIKKRAKSPFKLIHFFSNYSNQE
jgi:hypothetical protein